MAYSVPPLPYDYNALEPHIDEETMRLHHDKHHQAYVDNANKALDAAFGSFDDFKAKFKDAGVNQFGSGWAWLVHDGSGLAVTSTPNQDNPVSAGQTPLLGVDVWEHAYYLKYQNRRPDYLDAFWNVVNWAKVAELHAAVS